VEDHRANERVGKVAYDLTESVSPGKDFGNGLCQLDPKDECQEGRQHPHGVSQEPFRCRLS